MPPSAVSVAPVTNELPSLARNSIQYSVYMLFMVVVGGMGTIEGPVLGALVLFPPPGGLPGASPA